MKYWPYVVREDEPCLPSWFSYRLPAARSGARLVEVAVERTNSREDEDGGSSKRDESRTIRGSQVLIPRTCAPLLFQAKTRGDARLCHAHASYFIGKCANTVLNPSLVPSLSSLFFFISFFRLDSFPASKIECKRMEFVKKNVHALIFMQKYIIS